MAIIRLSESTINLIAAGEVIERPASVVKELVENSIDAGATKIEVYLEQAGKNLIAVVDNGAGMSPEDMAIAIERHTTSKLDESDILNIQSFGFRGEALPSIFSVSKLSMVSKLAAKDIAFKLQLIEGKPNLEETLHDVGTKIEVKDLFYSVPARLKFLKSNQTELSNCVEVVKKLALTSPNISFKVTHEDKVLLKLERADDIKTRIKNILGDEFANNSVEVDLTNEFVKIYGYVSLPTHHRASADEQFVFVNCRPVKDKLLSGSIKAAYQDYIVQGRYAPLALFVEVPYRFVDVNVHPAKSEVRFQDSAKLRNSIVAAIKNAISKEKIGVSTTFASQAIDYFANTRPVYNNTQAFSLSEQGSSYKKPSLPGVKDSQFQLNIQTAPESYTSSFAGTQEHVKPSDIENFELGAACAQLHNNYIIAQTRNGIVMIDQHAAHERIVYEQLKVQLEKEPLKSQKLLLPVVVELSSHKVAGLVDNQDHFAKLALVLEKFSDTKIVVHEVPNILIQDDIAKLVNDIADEVSESEQEFSLTRLIEHVIETYACHHSIRSGQKLSINEMNALLRQIESTPGSDQCCHGRPTYISLTLKDLEKLFCRK
jgi:DNA mismatch repair protein MutL